MVKVENHLGLGAVYDRANKTASEEGKRSEKGEVLAEEIIAAVIDAGASWGDVEEEGEYSSGGAFRRAAGKVRKFSLKHHSYSLPPTDSEGTPTQYTVTSIYETVKGSNIYTGKNRLVSRILLSVSKNPDGTQSISVHNPRALNNETVVRVVVGEDGKDGKLTFPQDRTRFSKREGEHILTLVKGANKPSNLTPVRK